jgi:hypothetical protein
MAKTATARKGSRSAKSAAPRDLTPDIKRVRRVLAATKLPGLEEALSYGMPSFKVMGKFLARVREPGVLVVMCAREEKELLMEVNPALYFETDHYKGWPAILVRLPKIADAELKHRLQVAWRMQAPRKLVAEHEGAPARAPARRAKQR